MDEITFVDVLARNNEHNADLYLFLDPATQNEFWTTWGYQLLQARTEWEYYYHNTSYSHLREASPIIIKVREGNVGNDVLETLTGQHWGCLFSTPFTLDKILDHCQRWLTVYFPNNQEHLFRWYSPKILHTFLSSEQLDDEDKFRLTHPFHALYTPTKEHLYSSLHQQNEVVASETLLPSNGWFHIEPEFLAEINHLYYHQELASLAVELFKAAPQMCMSLDYKQVINGLDAGIQTAAQYKHVSNHVRKLFAFSQFFFGSQFWQYPEFSRAVQMGSLGQALYQLHHRADWQQDIASNHHNPNWLVSLEEKNV